jgi:hypothetical protein
VVFGIKVGRHAAKDFAILAHAPSKRNALQLAVKGIAPLMIGTDKFSDMAMTLATKSHATVSADVLDHMDVALCGSHHDDRSFTYFGSFEITGLRNFGFQTHIAPVTLVKKALHFAAVQFGAGVDRKGDAVGEI